jgi:hypothetical protein
MQSHHKKNDTPQKRLVTHALARPVVLAMIHAPNVSQNP